MRGFSSSRTSTIRSAPGSAQPGNPHWPEAIRVPVARTRSPTPNAVPFDGFRSVPRPYFDSTPPASRPGGHPPGLHNYRSEAAHQLSGRQCGSFERAIVDSCFDKGLNLIIF